MLKFLKCLLICTPPRSVERTFHPEPDTLPYVRRLRERYGRWCEACRRFSQWHPEEEEEDI